MIDTTTLDAVLESVFSSHPNALFVAIDANGLFVPMPHALPTLTIRPDTNYQE